MKLRCPKCDNEFPEQDVNASANVAYCRTCGEGFALAELLGAGTADDPDAKVNLYEPPPGAWFEEFGDGFELGASTRSCMALFLVPFTLVWSGGSLGGIYGSQIAKGQFDLVMSLFGIPFFIGSIFLIGFTLMTVCGKIVVTVRNNEDGVVFIGVGPLGYRKRFNWSRIYRVAEVASHSSGRVSYSLVLEGDARVDLGRITNDARHRYMRAVLKAMLALRKLPTQARSSDAEPALL